MATATQWGHIRELDTAKWSSTSCHFEKASELTPIALRGINDAHGCRFVSS